MGKCQWKENRRGSKEEYILSVASGVVRIQWWDAQKRCATEWGQTENSVFVYVCILITLPAVPAAFLTAVFSVPLRALFIHSL